MHQTQPQLSGLEIIEEPDAHCTMFKQFTYRILWRPEKHYVAGTQFEVRSHCLRAFLSWRYTKFLVKDGDITFRWKLNPSTHEVFQNKQRVLFRVRLSYSVCKGEPVELQITTIAPIWAGLDNILSIWTLDVKNNAGPVMPEPVWEKERHSECCLSVVAGPVERLSVYSRPMPGVDGRVRTAIVPEDRFGNPGRFAQSQECELTWFGSVKTISLQDLEILHLPAPTQTARARICVPMSSLSSQENIANGQREGDQLIVTGNPVWPAGAMKAAFGEFHWHTDFSGDGQRSIIEALRCARDELNLDFAAPGDHNPQGEHWQQTVEALEAANRPDEFTTFFGWENSSNRGHENYYFTTPDHPLICGGSAGITSDPPIELVDKLSNLYLKEDFFAVPHHTNAVSETRKQEDDSPYWYQYSWDQPQDYIRLVEIFQTRGNQEREVYNDAWRGWHQNNHASAQQALAMGYKIGFTGGTDNHCGWPGRAFSEYEGIGIHPPKSVILTGVWVPQMDRQSVFNGLKARHTWAVWDTRALVEFSVNGAAAGDQINVTKGTQLTAHIRLSAEDALQTVELISQGTVVWQKSFHEMDIEIDIPLGQAQKETHFYLRALQRDGGIIYASPVFVTPTKNTRDKI